MTLNVAPKKPHSERVGDHLKAAVSAVTEKIPWAPRVASTVGALLAPILAIPTSAYWGADGIHWWNATFFWLVATGFFVVLSVLGASALAGRAEKEKKRAQHEKNERVDEKVRTQAAIGEAVVPLLRSLSRLADLSAAEKRKKVKQTIAQVSTAKAKLFPDLDDVRIVVFQIWPTGDSQVLELHPLDHYGRSEDVPSSFLSNVPGRGVRVFEWLNSTNPKPKFVPDCSKEIDPSWAGTGNGYRTFISVPIVANGRPLGMITVDSPQPGDLDETDIPLLQVLAHALATAFVVCPS